MSWIVIQIVEPLYCREMVKCFVQVILLFRFDINATKYDIISKSFTVITV